MCPATIGGMRSWVMFFLAFACVAPASASSLPVPVAVQRQIQRRVGQTYRWVPMFVPDGEAYGRWERAPHGNGFSIFFNRRGGPTDDLIFNVAPIGSCGSQFGPTMRTFNLRGLKVHWSATYEDQQAWRCVTSGGVRFAVWATQAHPGAGNPRSRRALDLARVVASAEPVR